VLTLAEKFHALRAKSSGIRRLSIRQPHGMVAP
jgi:hypothetical protein